jgi:hypothetical protein
LVNFQLYYNESLLYTLADLNGLVFQSNTNYPFNDPNNLSSYQGIAFWTSDENISSKNYNVMTIESLTLTDIAISKITLLTPSTICFPAGTPILTDQGSIAIEKINPDIHTINKKSIIDITKTITQDKYLVGFKKNALGVNYPNDNTVMARGNKIYFEGRMQYVEYFLGKYSNVVKSNYTGEVLYNVLLEEQSRIYVNKLICETLHPSNEVAKLYMNGYKLIDNAQNDETIVKKNEKKTLDNSLRYFYFQFSDNK